MKDTQIAKRKVQDKLEKMRTNMKVKLKEEDRARREVMRVWKDKVKVKETEEVDKLKNQRVEVKNNKRHKHP